MKISELIGQLEKLIEMYGDTEIQTLDDDGKSVNISVGYEIRQGENYITLYQ